MVKGQEETSISQAWCKRGLNRELPTTSTFVSSMSMEELRSYCQIPDSISLELSDGLAASTVEADSAIYFIQE